MRDLTARQIVIGAAVVAVLIGVTSLTGEPQAADRARLFELRTYTTHDGKLDDLHARFRDHTNDLFVKHGMELIGYWTPTDGPESNNTLIYVLAYPDLAAREAAWEAFIEDPVWKKAYQESHADGPLVAKVESKYLAPTDYSPIR